MPRPSPLKAAAATAGLSLADVARETGYSPGTLGQVSRGRAQPWPELRRRLTALFGYDPLDTGDGLAPIRQAVTATRAAQDLPPTVVDDRTLQKV
ncbi:MAG: helix-turn-helix domain-containing protein, partial [Iamia sp.]